MSITLSSGVRQNLASLQNTSALQSMTQNRLATGKKVNSALDNPTSFFTASGLNNRASDLNRLMDDMGQAVKSIEAADKALKGITKLVESAQSIAKQAKASQDVTTSTSTVTGSAVPTYTAQTGTFTIAVGSGSAQTVTLDSTAQASLSAVASKINADTTGLTAAFDSGTNRLTITADDGTQTLTIGTGTGVTLSNLGLTAGPNTVTTTTTNAAKTKAQTDFNDIRTQIDQLVKDASYNGVNLLTSNTTKMTVAFNEDSSSKLEVSAVDFDATGLGINAASTWATNAASIDTAIGELKAATDKIRSQASTFGANLSIVQNRQDFTKSMIDTLKNGADELTNADMNQEAANLLSLQTRAQLANTALSMASQQDQGILRLF